MYIVYISQGQKVATQIDKATLAILAIDIRIMTLCYIIWMIWSFFLHEIRETQQMIIPI